MKKRMYIISLMLVLVITLTACTGNINSNKDVKEETTKIVESGVKDADVIVVGGGGSGLVAALKAAEEGASVILIEKQGVYGGATSMSSGKIPAFDTEEQRSEGISDTKEDMLRDIYRSGDYTQNYDILEKAVAESTNIKNWLENYNIAWELETNMIYYGQTNYRIHVAEGGGGQLVNHLVEAVEANENILALTNVKGKDLLTDDEGEVVGVLADYNGEEFELLGNSVVLATSGFGANIEMVQKYTPSIKNAVINVAPGATGEGILWGQELGAGVSSMSAYQAYAPISEKTHKSLGASFLNNGGFLLNKDGNRFVDEYLGYSPLGTAIANQPDHFAYMIWDSNIHSLDIPTLGVMEDDELIKAESIAELAKELNISAEKMKEQFELYHKGIEAGEDYMNRTKLPKKFEAPYYAIKVAADFRHTQGGLIFDIDTAQILMENSDPIPNLYGGGGVIEGFSSSGSANYMAGNGLLQAFVYGHMAGESAALNATSNKVENFGETKEKLLDFIGDHKIKIEKSDTKYKNGEYTGVGAGLGGDIQVKVTIKDEVIKSIEILEHKESKGISDPAIVEIPKAIEEANTPEDIDVVTGATLTSKGIIEAVNDALTEAK